MGAAPDSSNTGTRSRTYGNVPQLVSITLQPAHLAGLATTFIRFDQLRKRDDTRSDKLCLWDNSAPARFLFDRHRLTPFHREFTTLPNV